MNEFTHALAERVLVCDGAMGTMLHAEGHSLNASLATLNLSNPALVGTIHESYVTAGVDIIQTNTFGASRHRLAAYGYGDRVRAINLAGARIAAEVRASSNRRIFAAGSVSPVVSLSQRNRIRRQERIDALHEQIEALVEGSVDLFVLETFGYLEELVEAVEVASSASTLPIVAQATFTDDGRTFAGETAQDVAKALSTLPVALIGVNCTMGPSGVFSVLREIADTSSLPLSAQPNAGLPHPAVAERSFHYAVDDDYFSDYACRYVDLGARLVGGCCGTTPDNLRAVVRAVGASERQRKPSAQRSTPIPERTEVRSPSPRRDLAERLSAGEFFVAVEIDPPLGGSSGDALDIVRDLPSHGVDQLFVAGPTSARAHISAMSFALQVQQFTSLRATLTTTTWDRSIVTLQAEMLGVFAVGIGNVLCETGTPPVRGDYPNVDGMWEVDDIALIDLLRRLNDGQDCDGLPLKSATTFTIGARCNPAAEDFDAEVTRTRAKLDAGADFLFTSPVYEPDSLARLAFALSPLKVPLLVSVRPLRSSREAELLRHEVPGVSIPDEALERMAGAGEHATSVGIGLAASLVGVLTPLAAGVVVRLGTDEVSRFSILEQLGR
jgi:methionine synthase / methylenetetrahydrofolate reductase(NADPH)